MLDILVHRCVLQYAYLLMADCSGRERDIRIAQLVSSIYLSNYLGIHLCLYTVDQGLWTSNTYEQMYYTIGRVMHGSGCFRITRQNTETPSRGW